MLTEPALADLTAAIERVQRLNDEWLTRKCIGPISSVASLRMRTCCADDWHAPAQWQRVGLSPPTCAPLSAEEKGAALGGCQLALDGGRGRLSRIFQSAIDNSAAGGPDETPVRAT